MMKFICPRRGRFLGFIASSTKIDDLVLNICLCII